MAACMHRLVIPFADCQWDKKLKPQEVIGLLRVLTTLENQLNMLTISW